MINFSDDYDDDGFSARRGTKWKDDCQGVVFSLILHIGPFFLPGQSPANGTKLFPPPLLTPKEGRLGFGVTRGREGRTIHDNTSAFLEYYAFAPV